MIVQQPDEQSGRLCPTRSNSEMATEKFRRSSELQHDNLIYVELFVMMSIGLECYNNSSKRVVFS